MHRFALAALSAAVMAGCAQQTAVLRDDPAPVLVPAPAVPVREYVGTTEPFAAHAVYFVVTDRFVNGDTSNDQREQGGRNPKLRTFDRPTPGSAANGDNIGYLGGDFKGLADNFNYIQDMGFNAVWITPIIDNPEEAFTGGKPAKKDGFWTDGGKTGYHGYWGVNFYKLDEHLPSPGLDFAGLTQAAHARDMKVVLDIVANHGSPAFSMPKKQPKFGEVYDASGALIADHANRAPEKLDHSKPLQTFFNRKGGLAELSDFNDTNPAVMEYLVGAYSQWIDQGADAFRIDTIGWMPDAFWNAFVKRMREKKPGMYMFGEAFDYDAAKIATHTWRENANVSVLDFPLKQAMDEVFGRKQVGYERIAPAMQLGNGPYTDPYALATFYDNHDMPRLDASDAGFIDAHNFLMTARGIPVVYYGSETGFMRGTAEHSGNRNYFGTERIAAARSNPIQQALTRIANVRRATPALQRGLQVNLELQGTRAAFYRVLQHAGTSQTALVLLNKGDAPTTFALDTHVQPGRWQSRINNVLHQVTSEPLRIEVPAHGVDVLVLNGPITEPGLIAELDTAQVGASPRD